MMKANVFVIPNEAVKAADCFYPDEMESYGSTICAMNDIDYDANEDKFLMIWFASEDSDNMSDHGFLAVDDLTGEEIYVPAGGLQCYVPAKLLNIKEGESTIVTFPVFGCGKNASASERRSCRNRYVVTMELTAAQLQYRYSRFGTFENVAEVLLSR